MERQEREFIKNCLVDARAANENGHPDVAWSLLVTAHIISQPSVALHTKVHWTMLRLAVQTRDLQEICGQVFRILLAAIGSLTGRYPVGNTGRSNVSAFKKMPIPPELLSFVEKRFDDGSN